MKRNSLIIFAAVTALSTVAVQTTLKSAAWGVQGSMAPSPIYFSQLMAQTKAGSSPGSASGPKQSSGSNTVPIVLGVLLVVAIGGGVWVSRSNKLRSRQHLPSAPIQDPSSVEQTPTATVVVPQPPSLVEEPPATTQDIVQDSPDYPEDRVPDQEYQGIQEETIAPDVTESVQALQDGVVPLDPADPILPDENIATESVQAFQDESIALESSDSIQDSVQASAQSLSATELKLEALQGALQSAQQTFKTLSQTLDQEIIRQVQALPDSILNPPSADLLPTQEQALEKLSALQAVFRDLELSAEGYFKLGNAWFNAQQYEVAIANYDKAINLDPDRALAWFNTAYIYALKEDFSRSVRYLKQAIHLNPDCLAIVAEHSGFHALRDNGQFEQLQHDMKR